MRSGAMRTLWAWEASQKKKQEKDPFNSTAFWPHLAQFPLLQLSIESADTTRRLPTLQCLRLAERVPSDQR